MSSLAPKNDFIGLEGCVHLAVGGETPQLKTIKEVLERFVEDKSGGADSRARFFDISQAGLRHDLHALAKVAHRNGAAILTDISHSLGVVPLDLADIDFTVCCTYKWLLGIHGLGIFH